MKIFSVVLPFFIILSMSALLDSCIDSELSNPAAVYCIEQGYEYDIRHEAEGDAGYCVFSADDECPEWAYYHGECMPKDKESEQATIKTSNTTTTTPKVADLGSLVAGTDKKLLIFASPQYKDDYYIVKAIQDYQKAVNNDINWGSEVILLDNMMNTVGKIRERIKNEYGSNDIKAVIIVGEDTSTVLRVETPDKKECPSVFLWSDMDEDVNYGSKTISSSMDSDEIDNILDGAGSIVVKSSTPEILVSLIYPSKAAYEEKKQKIINAFEKFSRDRKKNYGADVKIFQFNYSNDAYGNKIKDSFSLTQLISSLLNKYTAAEYVFDCEPCNFGLNNEYKIYAVQGHGSPSSVQVSSKSINYNFRLSDLKVLKSPLFIVLGCHATCWYTTIPANQKLDVPEGGSFSQKIFSNPNLRVVIGGGAAYNSDEYSSFMNKLDSGITIAESFIGSKKTIGGMIMYGDPTFHY